MLDLLTFTGTEDRKSYSLTITVSVMGLGLGIGTPLTSTPVVLGCGVAVREGGAAVGVSFESLSWLFCLLSEASVLLFFLSVWEVKVTGEGKTAAESYSQAPKKK